MHKRTNIQKTQDTERKKAKLSMRTQQGLGLLAGHKPDALKIELMRLVIRH